MNVNFPDADEHFIKSQVKNGYYINETELVRDAVRRMREANEKKDRFYQAVLLGDEQIERGETVAYNKERLEHITVRAVQRAKNGDQPNSDVTPV